MRMGLVDCILYSVFACVDGCVRDQVCLCVLFKSKGPCHGLINGEQCVCFYSWLSSWLNSVCVASRRLAVTAGTVLSPSSTWNNGELQSLCWWPLVNNGKIMWSMVNSWCTHTHRHRSRPEAHQKKHSTEIMSFSASLLSLLSICLFVYFLFFTFNIAVLK